MFNTTFGNKICVITKGKNTIVTGSLQVLLYEIGEESPAIFVAAAFIASSRAWHERLAHVNEMRIVQMLKKASVGVYHDFLKAEDPNVLHVPLLKHIEQRIGNEGQLSMPLNCSTFYTQMCVILMRLHQL